MKKVLLLFAISSLLLVNCDNPFMEQILGRDKDKGQAETDTIPPEQLSASQRWSTWVADDSKATINLSVDNGVATITVSGDPEPNEGPNQWFRYKTSANYSYTAKANTSYVYEFEAWTETESGNRSLNIQYYNDWVGGEANIGVDILGEYDFSINSTQTTYKIYGKQIPKGGIRQVEFQCADQLGTFYVKMISITKYTDELAGLDFLEKIAAYNNGSESMTISLTEDVDLTAPVTIEVSSGKTLTITNKSGDSYTITRGAQDTTANSGLFIVSTGAKLTFENIVIDGDKGTHTTNAAPLVRVNSGGTFTMGTGAVLKNNRASNGGGVYVASGGEFIMTGGEISENTANNGGGVYVSGTFTMSGSASVSDNTAGYGGGAYIISGDFIMSGSASVSGNTAISNGGGVLLGSSGCTFTMQGNAEVSDNTAVNGGGVAVTSGGKFDMNGGMISENTATSSTGSKSGGGVYVDGTFNMSGGNINGNTADTGGGVFVVSGRTFTMSGSASVSVNTAYEGGGVYISGGTFTMNNGTISGNIISNNGGGVYVTRNENTNSVGTFNMYGGTISGHTTARYGGGVQAHNYGNFNMYGGTILDNKVTTGGGGVRIENYSNFNMTGGTISGNTVSATTGTGGGGVYVSADTSKFTMSGGTISENSVTSNNANSNGGGVHVISGSSFTVGGTAKISGNTKGTTPTSNNVYLPNNTYITLGTGNPVPVPASDMDVWVQTATASGVIVNSGAANGDENYFHADDAGRDVIFLQDGKLALEWLVYDVATLQKIGKTSSPGWTLSAYYKQTADIVLTPPVSGQSNWTPIGISSSSSSFTGTYNGGGHTITGLTINASTNLQGMFGYIGTGGIVENLGLINVNITYNNGNTAGGIAGTNSGTIQNCYVSGSLTGDNSNIGGIAGTNNGTIQNCYVSGSVVNGLAFVGGIVGDNSRTIKNCVALNEKITRSTANSTDIGRVVGKNSGSNASLQNNYAWNGMTVTGGTVTAGTTLKDGEDITAAQAKDETWWKDAGNWNTASPATAWDFTNVWKWNANGMPSLRGVGTAQAWPGYLED